MGILRLSRAAPHERAALLLLTLLAALPMPPALGDGDIRTVVLTGDHLPGVPGDLAFGSSLLFRLNNHGQVLFNGRLTGPGITNLNDGAAWLDTPGAGLQLLARNGQQAPGSLEGINIFDLDTEFPELNDAGYAQLRSFIIDSTGANRVGPGHPDTDNIGDWVWRPNVGLTRLAFGEDPTPTLGHRFTIAGPAINNQGQQIRAAQLTPSVGGFTDSLWLIEAGVQPQLVLQRGAQAPNLASGILFGQPGFANVNNAGLIHYQSRLTGPGVTTTNDEAIWLDHGGGVVELVAREGNQAPGLPAGVLYNFATGTIRVSDAGRITLSRLVTGPGVTLANNYAWWSGDTASILALIAREGDAAPGTAPGVVFDNLLMSGPAINPLGKLATPAVLRGAGVHIGNDIGVWEQGANEALALVAREGDPAPGAEANVVFDFSYDPTQIPDPTFSGNVSLNAAGQLMIASGMAGPGITAANDRAIWAEDRHGALQLIVREGQQLDVDDSPAVDLRTVSLLGAATPPMINNLGQVIFRATFTDGAEGIFVSTAVARHAADFNHDGAVDAADLAAWRAGFGKQRDAAPSHGDADSDLDVDGADFLTWQREHGSVATAAVAAIPEPARLALAGAAILSALGSLRRRS